MRARLSRQADDEMRTAAEASRSAVLVSFWRREDLSTTSGTPTGWLRGLRNVVELYCACRPAAAVERFLARDRHPGHGDGTRDRNDLMRQFEALDALGPIGIGRLVCVNTERKLDVESVMSDLR